MFYWVHHFILIEKGGDANKCPLFVYVAVSFTKEGAVKKLVKDIDMNIWERFSYARVNYFKALFGILIPFVYLK